MKTLITPPPQGLVKLWRNHTSKVANTVDKVIIPGNIVSLMPKMKDYEKGGVNSTILRLVMTYIETHDDAVALIGPNEIIALSRPRKWANDRSLWRLKNYWLEGPEKAMKVATVVNGRLVTHGGLTYGEWSNIGKPSNPYDAAELLNRKYYGTLFPGSSWSLGGGPNYAADPIFAHPFKEFYPSWITSVEEAPFGQIIASRSLNSEEGREAMASEHSPMNHIGKISFRKFGSIALLNGQEVTSVGLRPQGTQITRLPDQEAFYIESA